MEKGQSAAQVVKSVNPKLDGKGAHKKFERQDRSIYYVFDIEFVNGYKAEYTFPGPVQPDFVPGKMIEFKVIDKNQYGETIVPMQPVQNVGAAMGSNSMSGHPVVFAFGFAKDLAPFMQWDTMDDIFKGSDEILEYLLMNKHRTSIGN